MFRITCFVDDKYLAAVMHGLAGMAKGLEVVPVAEVKANGVSRHMTGDLVQLFAEYLDTHKGEVTPAYVQEVQRSIGRSPGGYNNVLHKAKQAKLIKQTGNGSGAKYARVAK